jgi:hypothetical protein
MDLWNDVSDYFLKRHFMKSLLKSLPVIVLVIGATLFGSSAGALAAVITLEWDPNVEEDLAGYRVYYGKASGSYRWAADVGNVTTRDLTGLTPGVTYFITLTAYDTSENENDFSNEVSGMGVLAPPNIVSFQINSGAAITASRTVILDNLTLNAPTHYQGSESATFVRAR